MITGNDIWKARQHAHLLYRDSFAGDRTDMVLARMLAAEKFNIPLNMMESINTLFGYSGLTLVK